MQHRELGALAHNCAESLASGLGLVLGHCETDIFGEARKAPEGHLTVDFLAGTISGGNPSAGLQQAITRYRGAFPEFYEKHGASLSDFRTFTVRFAPDYLHNRFILTVEDARGHRSTLEYAGMPGQRLKVLDEHGRLRPKVG